jgi:hypothetical protein
MAQKRHRQWVVISDPHSFQTAVEAFVTRSGSCRKAASIAGVPHAQLNRIRSATRPYRMLKETFWKVASHLWREQAQVALATGLVDLRRLDRYKQWLARLIGWSEKPAVRWNLDLVSPGDLGEERRVHREKLLEELRPLFPKLFDAFDQALARSLCKPTAHRRELAYDRVLSPFLDSIESFGFEVDWREFVPIQGTSRDRRAKLHRLKRILTYGMRREALLLERLPDDERSDELRLRTALGIRKPGALESEELRIHQMLASDEAGVLCRRIQREII